MRRFWFCWCLAALLSLVPQPTQAAPRPLPSSLTASLGKKATAVVFVATNCPIVNRNAPLLVALARDAKKRGGALVLVYSNPGDQAQIPQHLQRYGLTGIPVVRDPEQSLARTFGAKVTPFALVLDSQRRTVYQGRISDSDAGQAQPKGTPIRRQELADALTAALAGKPIRVARTEAVGCVIETSAVAKPAGPTYAADIAPILNANCVSCHRAGEIGPMALDSFDAARRFARNIAHVTQKRLMPPWKPTNGHENFVGARKLDDAQIALIRYWVEAGAPAGNLAKAPVPPAFAKGWTLGEPDLVLKMPTAWNVPATGADDYRCFVLPTNLTEDKEVVAVEYRAGNKAVVHHVLGFVDRQGRGRKLDAADAAPGYTSFGGPGFLPDGEVGGWAPGNIPQFLPDGIARQLPAGSDIVMQVHYHANGKAETDVTQVGLYFAKKPAKKFLRILPLIAGLDIPADEPAYQTSTTFTMPFDAQAVFIVPHMHLLGKQIGVGATLSDGTQKSMIQIDDWDFNWQDNYTYKSFFALPKGTKLTLRATYDNSTKNPRQPNNPPQRVGWGEATTDEMCIAFIGYIADREDDPMAKLYSRLLGGRSR